MAPIIAVDFVDGKQSKVLGFSLFRVLREVKADIYRWVALAENQAPLPTTK